MKKLLFLILVIFLIGCSAPDAPIIDEPLVTPEPVEVVKEPVEEVIEEPKKEIKEVAPGPEGKAPQIGNRIPEGFIDLQNYKGTAEEILFKYLDKLDKEQFDNTQQRRYMKIEKPYEGQAKIYYPKWVNVTDEFLEKEANMIGNVWAEANEGKSQYFEATLYDYRGVKVANVIVKNSEVTVALKKSISIV